MPSHSLNLAHFYLSKIIDCASGKGGMWVEMHLFTHIILDKAGMVELNRSGDLILHVLQTYLSVSLRHTYGKKAGVPVANKQQFDLLLSRSNAPERSLPSSPDRATILHQQHESVHLPAVYTNKGQLRARMELAPPQYYPPGLGDFADDWSCSARGGGSTSAADDSE
jgi:hypothetical protein